MTKFNGYFDNAATSFPKPKKVGNEILRYLNDVGGPYGRGFYDSALEVSRVVEETRALVANKLGGNADNLVFMPNATYAINVVLKGLKLDGKDVLVSPLEHNAVMRPLKLLEKRFGINIKVLPAFSDGLIDVRKVRRYLSPRTALVIINHQSNVNGVIQPVAEIKKGIGDIPILVDAAQSAGHVDINIDENDLDFVAFTGHKGLLGPTGTGGLFIKNHKVLHSSVEGGTGSRSESFEMPVFMPDKFEAGTPNIVGIFGLLGALSAKKKQNHSLEEFYWLINEVKKLNGYTVFCADSVENQGSLFSLQADFASCSDVGMALYEKYKIQTRIGLHCAPMVHKFLKTYPEGTLRISPSPYHTVEDFEFLIKALRNVRK